MLGGGGRDPVSPENGLEMTIHIHLCSLQDRFCSSLHRTCVISQNSCTKVILKVSKNQPVFIQRQCFLKYVQSTKCYLENRTVSLRPSFKIGVQCANNHITAVNVLVKLMVIGLENVAI